MSTLSPEAKQAAEEWGKGKYHTVYERECFAEGYDAATAKLRACLLDLAEAGANEAAKLREELEATRDAVIRLVKLVHQQPGTPTAEGTASSTKANTHRGEVSENEGSNPSRSTADVEKIVFDLQVANLLKDESRCGLRKVGAIIAQARAPLVEALEAWGDFPHPIKPHCDDCARAAIRAMELSFAALTGTEKQK